jgi:hypothetical protein
VTFALGFQPIENSRVETHTHRYLSPDVTSRIMRANCSVVRRGMSSKLICESSPAAWRAVAPERTPLLVSPLPVPDIFGDREAAGVGR